MPPSRKRPRSYDDAKVRAAVLAQFRRVAEAVRGLSGERLAAPAGLGAWTVRDLAAHLTMSVGAVASALERPEPNRADLTLLDWASTTAEQAEPIAAAARQLAGGDLVELYDGVAERVAKGLAQAPPDRLLDTRTGAMTLTDYLVTRTVELTVHTDDLNRATGLDVPLERQALATAVRLLADTLAAKAPGGATEVRIPPFAVVQCVEGPRHTRGTPPNVVETDPLTWLRLATGRTTWEAAREAAKVAASGERADLSGLLPLLG
ncbi:sterol carrier family protein [Streptomyces sp. NPDC050560]|uniref:maleylpyruvate isomerase family mycothiol-dependent enzyme n=1 Tax=Streptomyces sp. NPDC050560 TaxID=3365630 RepID=UPI00379F8395